MKRIKKFEKKHPIQFVLIFAVVALIVFYYPICYVAARFDLTIETATVIFMVGTVLAYTFLSDLYHGGGRRN